MSSYDSTASWYDAIYTKMKDYRQEAERVRELITTHCLSPRRSLLDVACGTGLHLEYLQAHFDATGMDLSPAQLLIAAERVPNVPLHQGDMTSFDLGRQYDVVTCLFSAIGHLLDLEALHTGIARMTAHLEPGGLLMVEGWLTPDMWHDGHVSIEEAPLEGGRVIRATISWREDRITTLEMHHFVTHPPTKATYEVVTHQTALYSVDEYLAAFRAAGLQTWFDPTGLSGNGRGVYLGLKPLV